MMTPWMREALDDLVHRCAAVQAGQSVLVVAAASPDYGGWNGVDPGVVEAVAEACAQQGAEAHVLWVSLEPALHQWRVPRTLRAAVGGADVLISMAFDLPFEELLELRELLMAHRVPLVRNMATTWRLLDTPWAAAPYRWVSAVREAVGRALTVGAEFRLEHPNGTRLQGRIGAPLAPFQTYAEPRTAGWYRPFPEGIGTPVQIEGVDGVLVFDETLPWWGRYLGLLGRFREPVRVTIAANRMVAWEGGAEARRLREFLEALARRVGESAFELAGLHGGVHPWAAVDPADCKTPRYADFVAHHHWGSLHLHLGANAHPDRYPYMPHITAELRGARWTVGDRLVYGDGTIPCAWEPAVVAVAQAEAGRFARLPDGSRFLTPA